MKLNLFFLLHQIQTGIFICVIKNNLEVLITNYWCRYNKDHPTHVAKEASGEVEEIEGIEGIEETEIKMLVEDGDEMMAQREIIEVEMNISRESAFIKQVKTKDAGKEEILKTTPLLNPDQEMATEMATNQMGDILERAI